MTLDDFKARLAAAVEKGKATASDPEFQARVTEVEARILAYRKREREIAEAKKGDVLPVPHWSEPKPGSEP